MLQTMHFRVKTNVSSERLSDYDKHVSQVRLMVWTSIQSATDCHQGNHSSPARYHPNMFFIRWERVTKKGN